MKIINKNLIRNNVNVFISSSYHIYRFDSLFDSKKTFWCWYGDCIFSNIKCILHYT